jgi:hypothetical protein
MHILENPDPDFAAFPLPKIDSYGVSDIAASLQ